MQEAIGDRASFAAGFAFDGSNAEALREEAVALAGASDIAVVFLGLTQAEESEGFDGTHIDLPAVQLELLDAVRDANENVVVVLSHGAVVALPFTDSVPAIVESWLLGQAGGSAVVDVLTGAVNPSARLAETVPHRLQDTPAYGAFPGSLCHVRYGEGLLVGYRWYDQREMSVAYPFGHGLSYSTFEYGEPTAVLADNVDVAIRVAITNTSHRHGREIVQVYVSREQSIVDRAPHPVVGPIVRQQLTGMQDMAESATDSGIMEEDSMMMLMSSFPIGRLAEFPGMGVTKQQVAELIALGNGS